MPLVIPHCMILRPQTGLVSRTVSTLMSAVDLIAMMMINMIFVRLLHTLIVVPCSEALAVNGTHG